MNVYYENTKGEIVNLSEWPVMIQEPETLLGYEWSYSSSTGIHGSSITDFTQGVVEKSATLSIFAEDKTEFADTLNGLHATTEYDILHNTSGKLYINGQYLPCYLISIDFQEYEEDYDSTDIEITVVSGYPFWCRDIATSFYKNDSEGTGTNYLDYPRNYKYDYTYNRTIKNLINEHYVDCDFQMVVYGPCSTPRIYINNHLYEVSIDIPDSGYMVIDTRFKTVKSYDIYGTETDVFNARNKENDIFKKISTGINTVSWSANFGFDIILFYERSALNWTLS